MTEADIDQFASQFRGSDEEAAEVLQYYERFKGDMPQVQPVSPARIAYLHIHSTIAAGKVYRSDICSPAGV